MSNGEGIKIKKRKIFSTSFYQEAVFRKMFICEERDVFYVRYFADVTGKMSSLLTMLQKRFRTRYTDLQGLYETCRKFGSAFNSTCYNVLSLSIQKYSEFFSQNFAG